MAATVAALSAAARLPGPPELLPGPARRDRRPPDATTARPSSAPRGASPTRACARSTSSSSPAPGRRTRSVPAASRAARTTSSPMPRRWTSTTPAGRSWRPADTMRRLRRRARVLQLVPHRRHDPGALRRPRRDRRRPIVFEVVVDDYAEVWVDGDLPVALGDRGRPGRRRLQRPQPRGADARRAPRADASTSRCSGSTARSRSRRANYIWMRSATLDVYAPGRAAAGHEAPLEVERHDAALDDVVPAGRPPRAGGRRLRVHRGARVEPGRRAAVLARRTRTRSTAGIPSGRVDVFRPKSGYTGARRRALRPARLQRAGLRPRRAPRALPARQPAGRPRRTRTATSTVLADALRRPAAEHRPTTSSCRSRRDDCSSPTRRSGCPAAFDDPAKELAVLAASSRVRRDGEVRARHRRARRTQRARVLRRDERVLYVGNWDPGRKVGHALRARRRPARRVRPSVLCDLHRRARRGRHRRPGKVDPATGDRATRAGPAASGSSRPTASASGCCGCPRRRTTSTWGDADGRTLLRRALTAYARISRHPPDRGGHDEQAPRSPARRSPTSSCPTRTATLHRLSELQGDDALVLHARPRRALPARAPAPARAGQAPRVVPGGLHRDGHGPAQRPARRLQAARSPTGAHWTFLADADLEVQRTLDINEYTDPHHANAGVPHTRGPLARPA